MPMKIKKSVRKIAFFGDSEVKAQSNLYKEAFDIARILAREGYVIVNGGGPGIMGASTEGAKAGGGKTISVTFDAKDAPGFEGKYIKNITDEEIKTTNYIERMFKLLETADIFIIFKGGTGTLSEFATAWVLAKLYYGHHKPFVLYGKHWIEIIEVLKRNMNLDENELSVFRIACSKDELIESIKRLREEIESRDHKSDPKNGFTV